MSVAKANPNIKNSKFLCGHRKGHSPCLTPIWSLYTLLFVITSAHTLLGPFIQLYSGNFIQSLYTCTAFCHYKCIHFEWLSLLYTLTLATHTCCAHTVLGSVVLMYIHTLVQSLFSGNLYTTALYSCTLASASLGYNKRVHFCTQPSHTLLYPSLYCRTGLLNSGQVR